MIVIAHRGYSSKAPENTMAAFELALEAGAGGLELDVHLSKDGEVVVIHDEKVDRTTDKIGLVRDFTMAELKSFDAGSWFSPDFKGEQLPSLGQVLDLVKGTNVLLNIETKTALGFERLNEQIAPLVDEYELWEQTIISSFNHYALVHFKQLRPQAQTAILYTSALVNPWVYAASIGASVLHPYHGSIIPEIVSQAQDHGMQVNVWTVDREADIERIKACKVDGIITNVVERVQSLI